MGARSQVGVRMPGRVFIEDPLSEMAAVFDADPPQEASGPRLDAAPGETFVVLVEGPLLREMRWQMIMTGRRNARGRPVMETIVNARSETVFEKSAYAGVRRGVLPVNGWYEWTGATGRKTRWRIEAPERRWLAFAAIWDIWRAPGGAEVAQMATLTVEPSADVKAIHHRMPAILAQEDVERWLVEGGASLLRPAPEGLLSVTQAHGDLTGQ